VPGTIKVERVRHLSAAVDTEELEGE
jgi:hypothetical protein